MKITKLEHSGIVIEKGGEAIIFDPVEFTEKLPVFENVVAVVVTHKHGDHLQADQIARILADNPNAKIFTTEDAVEVVPDATVVKAGDAIKVGSFDLDIFGKDHASIVAGQVPCDNIGVVVDGKIVNPGDSFDLPDVQPEVLFVPISAPWCKISESIDFIKKARPKVVIPVHDAVLSDLGKGFNNNWLKVTCDEIGAEFEPLKSGESLIVD